MVHAGRSVRSAALKEAVPGDVRTPPSRRIPKSLASASITRSTTTTMAARAAGRAGDVMSFALLAVPGAARKPLAIAVSLLALLHVPAAAGADLLEAYRDAQANDAQFGKRPLTTAGHARAPAPGARRPSRAGARHGRRATHHGRHSSPVDVTRYFNANTWALQASAAAVPLGSLGNVQAGRTGHAGRRSHVRAGRSST